MIKSPLKQMHDDRGKVMHMLRATDAHFKQFGEIYFSWIYPKVIKAWHKHLEMQMNYAVPVGGIKLVLYDAREHSQTYTEVNEFYMSAEDYYLLTIPHGIWYGFQAIGEQAAMIVNCTTMPHEPQEMVRIDVADPKVPYSWALKHA